MANSYQVKVLVGELILLIMALNYRPLHAASVLPLGFPKLEVFVDVVRISPSLSQKQFR